jgi:hypothetical protein
MASQIQPTIVDCAMGEVSPELAGRVDLAMAQHGMSSMLNMIPGDMGGAFKRGGLRRDLDLGEDTYFAPWPVRSDLPIVVCIQDRKIKFIAVPETGFPYFLEDSQGNVISITSLGGSLRTVSTYSIADAENVKYAACIDEISFAHKLYPSFFVKLNNVSADLSSIDIEYGIDAITGNVASNPEIDPDNYSELITAAAFIDAFHALSTGVDYTAQAGSYIKIGGTNKTVSKISITGTVTSRRAIKNPAGTVYTDAATAFGAHRIVGLKNHNRIDWGHVFGHEVVDELFEILPGTTHTQLLEKLKENIGEGSAGFIGDPDDYDDYLTEWFRYYEQADTRTVLVTFSDATTLSVTKASADLSVNLKLSSPSVEISGGVIDSSVILDYTIPWMTAGKTYPCSTDSKLNGIEVLRARRVDEDPEPKLEVWRAGEATPMVITRDTLGITGKVGVIVTPFYEPLDYPSCVCYHQMRKVLGGSAREPNIVYLSKVNDFTNFAFFEEIEFTQVSLKPAAEWADPLVPETRSETSFTQQIAQSSAMKLQFNTDDNESINNLVSYGDLFVGSGTSEWVIPAAANAVSVQALLADRSGSSDIMAIYAMGGVVFVAGSGKRVSHFDPKAGPSDLMRMAGHMGLSGISDLDYRQSPRQEIWVRLKDGTCAMMTRGPNGLSWVPMATSTGRTIQSMCVIRSGDEDAVFMVVKKGSAYSMERLVTTDDSAFPTSLRPGRAHLDGYVLTTATSGIVGMTMFASQSVRIHINTTPESRGVVAISAIGAATQYIKDGDAVATAIPDGDCILGYPFDAELETSRLDSMETEGYIKMGTAIHLRLYQSGSFNAVRYNHGIAADTEIPTAIPLDGMGNVVYPFSGAMRIENPNGSDTDQKVKLTSHDGQPFGVLVLAPTLVAGEAF